MIETHLLLFLSITLFLIGILSGLTAFITSIRCASYIPITMDKIYPISELALDTQETPIIYLPPSPLIYRMVSEIAVILIEPDNEEIDRSEEKARIQRLIQYISMAS